MAEKWNRLITREGNELRFQNGNAGRYKVRHAFILLQNYLSIDGLDIKVDKPHIVKIQIGGQPYGFRMELARNNGKRQIYISGDNEEHGVRYRDVFKELDNSYSGIDQREAARYILEASEALINEAPLDWTTRYSFLDKKRCINYPLPIQKRTLRDVLNEIMVVGQVAEAAAPTEEYFNTWMEISDRTTGKIQDKV